MEWRNTVKVSRTLVLAVFVAATLTAPNLVGSVSAHPPGGHAVKTKGNSKHYYCYDKHGRWRSHPHCPPPRYSYSPRYYEHPRPYYGHYHHHHAAGYRYQRRPQVIYVRKDAPYDYRSRYTKPAVRDTRNTVNDARREVQLGRDQLRQDRTELKNDRAELRRDIRNNASKAEIRSDRQEIRADLQKIESTRQEIRSDRRELARR
jgi:hypothetical protein